MSTAANLTVTTTGLTTFEKSVSGLASLTTDGGGGQTVFGLSGSVVEVFVTTSGAQTYVDEIDAWPPTTLTGSSVTTLGGIDSALSGAGQTPPASITTIIAP